MSFIQNIKIHEDKIIVQYRLEQPRPGPVFKEETLEIRIDDIKKLEPLPQIPERLNEEFYLERVLVPNSKIQLGIYFNRWKETCEDSMEGVYGGPYLIKDS